MIDSVIKKEYNKTVIVYSKNTPTVIKISNKKTTRTGRGKRRFGGKKRK